MIKKYISIVGMFCGLHMLSYIKVDGSFMQPSFYCNKDNAIAVVLPYKEGKCTKKSKDHLKKLAHFAQALNEELIPATTPFKILITTIQNGTSGVCDLTNFSSQLILLLTTGKQRTFTFMFKPSPDLLNLKNSELIDMAFLEVSTFPLVLYVTDEAYVDKVQTTLSTLYNHHLCTKVASLNPAIELVYSLLYQLGHAKKSDIVKACFSQTCEKPSTTSCEKCRSFWYCSSDCDGYEEHVNECKGLLFNDSLYNAFKNTSHIVTRDTSGMIGIGHTLENDYKKPNIKKMYVSIDQGSNAHLMVAFNKKCNVCQVYTSKRCKQCNTTYYCSATCQKSNWHEHKKICNNTSNKRSDRKKKSYFCTICETVTHTVVFCPGCKIMFYCSHACQQRDLKDHGKSCEKLHCTYCEKSIDKILLCAQCKGVMYCSRECQKADWKGGHKKICLASTSV